MREKFKGLTKLLKNNCAGILFWALITVSCIGIAYSKEPPKEFSRSNYLTRSERYQIEDVRTCLECCVKPQLREILYEMYNERIEEERMRGGKK